jgi:hypothetical protein
MGDDHGQHIKGRFRGGSALQPRHDQIKTVPSLCDPVATFNDVPFATVRARLLGIAVFIK